MASIGRFRQNKSMNSTQYMSCNQSYNTAFYTEKRPSTAIQLSYAHIPMKKNGAHWNQSSSTWRHTPRKYSIPKDSRFKDSTPYYTDMVKLSIPSTQGTKSCTFGKGKRAPISAIVLRNAQEKPAPDRYDLSILDAKSRQKSKGKTFGIGWDHYQKTFIKHRTDAYAEFHTQGNPSAKYQTRENPGKNKAKFTAYGRLKMYSEKMADDKSFIPGSYHKVKDRHLYGTVGLSDRNFSSSQRIDLSKPLNENPEAIYYIPGFCDKFTNLKRKKERNLTGGR